MKLRLVLISLGLCVIGASWSLSRPVTDKHVFAPTTAAGAVEAASTKQPDATPDPNQTYDDGPSSGSAASQARGTGYVPPYQPATTPTATAIPTVAPQPEPTIQPTPEPTIAPKPLPTPIGCGKCGQYPIQDKQGQIMCLMHMTPVYCLE